VHLVEVVFVGKVDERQEEQERSREEQQAEDAVTLLE